MSTHAMQSSTMQFGPEWMRVKPAKPHNPSPPPPPPAAAPVAGASSYSALVSPAPAPVTEKRDETHPFRYSRDEMLKIYRDGGGKGGLGLEVERYEGIVREAGSEPVGLREMNETEKKLFAGSLNSELRRRQSIDYLSPLATQGLSTERPRLTHSSSTSATGSPLRERFGTGLMRRRDSSAGTAPRKLSLSGVQAPLSPRDAALPSPRTRFGHTPTFDGVLNGGESWVSRRRASEAKAAATANASREPDGHEGRSTDIREEDEDKASLETGSSATVNEEAQKKASPPPDPPTSTQPTPVDGISYTNGIDPPSSAVPNGPPPGIQDLAAVQWSYLDPQGQLQGPFRADLMQKWYDDGYFTADLLMKRTHLDTDWVAVGELAEIARLSGIEKLFLAPPLPPAPPGIPRPADLSGQPFAAPIEQNTYTAPLQPAPVRSLRSSTLDAYAGGSSHSESPSSSFGAGRFGNGSPDSSGFGGRAASSQYSTDVARFGVAPESSSALRRNAFGDPLMEPSPSNSRFTGGRGVSDPYPINGTYSASQVPWAQPVPAANPLGSGFDTMGGAFGSSPSIATNLNHGDNSNYSHIRVLQDSPYGGDSSAQNISDYTGSPQISGPGFGPGQGYSTSALHGSPYIPQQSPAVVSNLYGQAPKPILAQAPPQNTGIPAAPTQSPWGAVHADPGLRRPAALDSVRPTAPNTAPVQASPWGTPAMQSIAEPSPWFAASQGVVDDQNWKEDRGHSLTVSNLGQHNQQFTSPPEEVAKLPAVLNDVVRPIETSEVDVVPAKPAATPPQPVKARTKSIQQPVVQPAVAPPPAPTVAESTTPVTPGPQKTAWLKEESSEAKRPSGVTVSLREIQDAEAKKAGARKQAERDRDRATRASSSAPPVAEETQQQQPFTASWGLPTSQAGGRAAPPSKESAGAAVATPSPTTGGAPAVVWTNAVKPSTAKKSMKEIQEEEEKRKKLASKETAATAARRAYAESTNKAPPPPTSGGAWTTVGAPKAGGATPASAPARPPAAPSVVASASASSIPRANGVVAAAAPPRSAAPAPVKALPTRVEDHPAATPSHEFVRWLNDSLKGLNSAVNVEEIMSMLLSFPLDPDASTVELISDLIYANSTTLDGRRFAAEFVSKRKADAASRPKALSGSGANANSKPVSIADVVKAQPKPPAGNEWGGFKVVNKKKKGRA